MGRVHRQMFGWMLGARQGGKAVVNLVDCSRRQEFEAYLQSSQGQEHVIEGVVDLDIVR